MGILLPIVLRNSALIARRRVTLSQHVGLRPQNRQAQAFQTSVIIPPVATSAAHGSPSDASSVPALPATNYCTPEMVQQMLISALSAMGFQVSKECSDLMAVKGDHDKTSDLHLPAIWQSYKWPL
ncbi:hypothetical protein F0562_008006 [Nyssa sinensis]|uniref:Uncharacterized protein n=1 Tax=Nyssa sinensis TaxID=561372 RepID=A0A5J5A6R6_9ASTE|nr:hypothetical protein F0562_008006 [Nyssa sinensis]